MGRRKGNAMGVAKLKYSCQHDWSYLQGSRIATIIVGSEQTKFYVHTEILCKQSDFFRRALKGHFIEAEQQIVRLPEDDSFVFMLFISWVYGWSGRFQMPWLVDHPDLAHWLKTELGKDTKAIDAEFYMSLFILADKLGSPELVAIVEKFLTAHITNVAPYLVPLSVIDAVYDMFDCYEKLTEACFLSVVRYFGEHAHGASGFNKQFSGWRTRFMEVFDKHAKLQHDFIELFGDFNTRCCEHNDRLHPAFKYLCCLDRWGPPMIATYEEWLQWRAGPGRTPERSREEEDEYLRGLRESYAAEQANRVYHSDPEESGGYSLARLSRGRKR